ncbi:MAG TPA: hypothetical protein VFR68_09370 [Candidatus Dormibacteraeota bacterium]|nr:hypothetical protein [Candidatus Dormibacteraeota bacterium]
MNKLRVLLVASALLLAACGGGAVLSSAKDKPATLAGSVQINRGVNAGSDLGGDDVNRVNPPIKKGGIGSQPSAPTQPQTVNPGAAPASGTATDRCSGGSYGGGTAGNRIAPMGGKHPPLPMCAVQ